MTQEEIFEGNKLIAEFMGWRYCEKDLIWISTVSGEKENASVFSGWIKKDINYIKGVPIIVVNRNKGVIDFNRKLLYHSSWDWLMPVVEKILEKIGVKSIDECDAKDWYVTTGVSRLTLGYSITFVFIRVIRYIEWYNNSCR